MAEQLAVPTFSEIARLAPLTAIVVSVMLIGGLVVYLIMSNHIRTLKDFINYLKGKDR